MGDDNLGQHMLDDDDLHSDYDEDQYGSGAKKQKRAGGKGNGKGKKAVSPADTDAAGPSARRTQNRLAQREFRQRKLAYVKELEAKVEFLGTSSNDQLETLKFLVKGLMEENQQLRKVLSGVCGFVGAGGGGHYGSLGFLKGEDLDAWVEAPQSDTLERLYSAYKAKRDSNTSSGGGGASSSGTSGPNAFINGAGAGPGGRSARTSPSRSPTVSTATTGAGSAPPPVPPPATRKRSRDANSRSSQPNTPVSSGPTYPSGPAEFQLNHPFHQLAGAPSFFNDVPPVPQEQHPQQHHGGPYADNQQQQQPLFPQPAHQSRSHNSQSQTQPQQIPQQQPHLSYPTPTTKPPSASSFFFDVQDPAAALSNSFTNDFLNEWINTGLTPSIETPGQTEFSWNQQQQSGVPLQPPSQQPSSANSNASLQQQQQQQQAASVPPSRTFGLGHPTHTDFMVHPDEIAKKYGASKVNIDYLVQSTPILQAVHLISYHKRNKRADPNYVLPLTLQPTVLQQTVPHDERIDGVILPSLRDALIREAPHLDLTEMFQDLLEALTVHSAEAPLDPINWEVHESFMRQYPGLAVPEMVLSANQWRRSRGEPDIVL